MKKIFTIILVAIGFIANAQSLRLIKEDGSYMTGNDTIDVEVTGRDEIDTYVGHENLTNQSLAIQIKQEFIVCDLETTIITFCAGGNCYDSDVSELIEVAPNAVVSPTHGMAFHSSYMGGTSPALVKYTFYNAADPNDKVEFYINYKTPVGISQADMIKSLRAVPNPASEQVTVSYVAPESGAYLVIKNLTGREVYRAQLDGTSGRKYISVSGFSAGVYLYGVESHGKMLCTKKLLVK